MFKRIIDFSVEQKPIIGFLVLVLIGFGIYAMLQLPIDAVPDITNNQVQIVTSSPSLSPQEVERLITYPLETAMANITDVIEIRSISRYGLSVITVVFKDKVPILSARQLVGELLQQAREEIPEMYGTPQMLPITTGLGEIFQYTLEVDKAYKDNYDAMKLREIQDWIVKRQLSGIPGIVEISSFGGYLKQYEIAVDPTLIKSHNITCSDIFDAVSKNNQSSGGSYIEKNATAYYIRAEGLLSGIDQIENIVVANRSGVPILVRDVARVQLGYAPRFGAMTKNGEGETVGGITLMLKGANSSKVIAEVKDRIKKIEPSLPPGIHIRPYLDRASLVKQTTSTVTKNLFEGGLIVILILILLLGNYRSGIIVASVIPLSLLFGFIMMHIFGVSANLMSLGAIDFGIVIDGAVIIVESILYHLHQNNAGKTLTQKQMNAAVSKGTVSIYQSASFGVIIILIVFIPIMSLTGIEGKNFKPMAQTFSFVIFGAFLLSMTYVPMMSSLFLKKKIVNKRTLSDKFIRFLKYSYHPVLKFSLRYKKLILIVTSVVFLASLISFPFLGGEFVPVLEEGDLAMQMTLPPGSSLQQSIKMSSRAEKILIDNFPEVEQVISKIGTAEVPTDPMAVEDADIMIVLKEKKEWVSAKTRVELIGKMKKALEEITSASFEFTQPIQLRFNELMTGTKSDVAVKIYGDDLEQLSAKANEAAQIIGTIQGAADIRIEQTIGLPQLIVQYKRDAIARYGLNIEQLNDIIRTAYVGTTTGAIFENDRKFDLVIRMAEPYRNEMNLNNLSVMTPQGTVIPFSEVASVKENLGPMQISRDNTRRRINIGVNVRDRDIQSLVNEIDEKLTAQLKLNPGYYIEYGGQFENFEHARKRLMIAVPIALLLILILLFFTFNSFRYALLIFTAVPLSTVGGIAALWIRGIPFSISAGVGFIALFGVAVLNGIVLISYYREMQLEGITNVNYIVIKGACTRLRPVLITATTDILGFLPMAVSASAGAEIQRPLATVVIGGIVTSTMLTLIILPILYLMMNSKDGITFRPLRTKKKWSRSLLLVPILALVPLNLQSQDSLATPISLDEAVQLALENNLKVKNAGLRVDQAGQAVMGSWRLDPAAFTYQYGQINSTENDFYLEANQNFGSIPYHINAVKKAKTEILAQQDLQKLIVRQIKAETRSAYQYYQYALAIKNIREQEISFYTTLTRHADLKFDAGDISLLQKSLAYTQSSDASGKYYTASDQVVIAQNQLHKIMMTDEAYCPVEAEPELYQIDKLTDTSYYRGTDQLSYYNRKYEQALQDEAMIKAQYFPEINAGIFTQRIAQNTGLFGWQVGIAVPLWLPSTISEVRQAKIATEIMANEVQIQQRQIALNIDNLLYELNQHFRQVRHYQEVALPHAEILLRTAESMLSTEEIDFTTYVQSISLAFRIQEEYYTAINNYNQTALQLEIYAE
ncbi:MAG: CusA/CzcA family heavy metal efflux RND transporter [Bacteroidales bacterium]|nr:CusA/CzcA family heavy metal efflux RND transporter [Bacteroidales bacterium]